ncbi:MAG: Lrp/AsnC ligand binding domain-containing protein [Sphaerochaeta sp.]
MAVGYVLITTAPSREHEVYDILSQIEEVVELTPLFGEFDMIAKIEADDLNLLGAIVVERIRSTSGVMDTKTLTGIRF